MTAITAPVTTRIKPEEKAAFARTCDEIGTSPANAIRMFIVAFNKKGGFPFDPSNPLGFTKETLAAMDDAENKRELSGPFKSNEDMWTALLDDEAE